ncbi:MAG: hypothetical protein ACOCQR_00210 [bacterium]
MYCLVFMSLTTLIVLHAIHKSKYKKKTQKNLFWVLTLLTIATTLYLGKREIVLGFIIGNIIYIVYISIITICKKKEKDNRFIYKIKNKFNNIVNIIKKTIMIMIFIIKSPLHISKKIYLTISNILQYIKKRKEKKNNEFKKLSEAEQIFKTNKRILIIFLTTFIIFHIVFECYKYFT